MFPLQLLVNGLIAGAIYSLIASGFSLIYGTNRFIHFAHGATAAWGGYIVYLFFTQLGVWFPLAVVLTLISAGLLGALMYWVLYGPLKRRKSSNAILLVASLGLMILLEHLIQLIFGPDVKTIGLLTVQKGLEFGSVIITPLQIVIIITSLVLLATLWLFVTRTSFGRMIRAVSDNPELASLSGIHTRRVEMIGFIIGSVIAGVAGILVGLEQNLEPFMGTNLMVKGFTGAVVGGISSLPGSVLGSVLLGLVENIGIWYIDSGYKDAIAFVLLLIFLIVRPQGILGIIKGIRE